MIKMASPEMTVTQMDLEQLFGSICSYVAELDTLLEWIVAKDEATCRIIVEPRDLDHSLEIPSNRSNNEDKLCRPRHHKTTMEPYVVSDLKIEVDAHARNGDDDDDDDEDEELEPDYLEELPSFKIETWSDDGRLNGDVKEEDCDPTIPSDALVSVRIRRCDDSYSSSKSVVSARGNRSDRRDKKRVEIENEEEARPKRQRKKPIDAGKEMREDPSYSPGSKPARKTLPKTLSKPVSKNLPKKSKYPKIEINELTGRYHCPVEGCTRKLASEHKIHQHMRLNHGLSPMTCKTCDAPFAKQRLLLLHRDSEHNSRASVPCRECPRKFSTVANRNLHVTYEHNQRTPIFKCEYCEKEFDKAETISQHLSEAHPDHVGDVAYCCGRRYLDERNLVKHVQTKHLDKTVFSCDFCDKMFAVKFSYTFHVETQHPEMVTYQRDFVCDVFTCQMPFSLPAIVERHKRKYHPKREAKQPKSLPPGEGSKPTSICPECGKEVANISLHTSKYHKKSASCHMCGKNFPDRVRMRRHVLFAHVDRVLKCPQCEKTFQKPEILKSHIRMVHVGIRFPCPRCPKSYSARGDLQSHVLAIHENKKWPCRICFKGLLRSSDRNRHERQVHGERVSDTLDSGSAVLPVQADDSE